MRYHRPFIPDDERVFILCLVVGAFGVFCATWGIGMLIQGMR